MGGALKKNIATVGGLTGISRILGFIRDLCLAWLLGAGPLADAFIVAFRIPNLLRRFFAEGAVSIAFVPVFSQTKEKKGLKEAFAMAQGVATWMFICLSAVIIAGEIIAPFLVGIIAPGFIHTEIFETTVHLTRIMFPYILLIGIVALAAGILNALGHFAMPAAAPILLNVFMVGMPLIFYVAWPVFSCPADAFAWGVILGGIAQIALQLIPLKKLRVPLGLTKNILDPNLKKISRLMGVAVFGASVYQLNVLAGTLLASLVEKGSVSYLYYAGRIMELPLGVFAFAVGNVMLPSMSYAHARLDLNRLSSLTDQALRSTLVFLIPSTIGIFMLSDAIFCVLFTRGAFVLSDALHTGYALRMYAIGLCAVGYSRILTQTFYAMQQPGIVVKTAWITLGINVCLSLILMPWISFAGIALANSVSVGIQVIILQRILAKKGICPEPSLYKEILKMVTAAILMGLCLFPLTRLCFWSEGPSLYSISMLLLCVVIGVMTYFGFLWLMGIRHLRS